MVTNKLPILVLGDVNFDTVILPCRETREPDEGSRFGWHEGPLYKMFKNPGGVWLMADVIQAAIGEQPKVPETGRVRTYSQQPKNDKNDDPHRLDSLAILASFLIEPEGQKSVYRIDPKGVLGSIRVISKPGSNPLPDSEGQRKALEEGLIKYIDGLKEKYSEQPWLVVVQDLHDIFRDLDPCDSIEKFLSGNPHFDKATGDKYKGDGLILWRMSSPLAQGKTWSHVLEKYGPQTIVVTNTDYLRKEGVDLRDDTSIEQKTDCLLDHFDHHSSIKKLASCSRLIVRFDNGVFHYTKNPEVISLHFHPNPKHRHMTESSHLGRMVGYMSVLVGALVKGLVWSFDEPEQIEKEIEPRVKRKQKMTDALTRIELSRARLERDDHRRFAVVEAGIESGIRLGIVLAGELFRNGYAQVGFGEHVPHPFTNLFADRKDGTREGEGGDRSASEHLTKASPGVINSPADGGGPPPVDSSGSQTKEGTKYDLTSFEMPRDQIMSSQWSRVDFYCKQVTTSENAAEEVSIRLVQNGLTSVAERQEDKKCPGVEVKQNGESMPNEWSFRHTEKLYPIAKWAPEANIILPYRKFGKIQTIDRDEIDNYWSIQALIESYREHEKRERPLSIAVFGTPGSGKSTAVKEILESIDKKAANLPPLEFNLAQFSDPKDLTTAFHQAQDRSLVDEVPLVIFDEFDTKLDGEDLGWLKYFLAPCKTACSRPGI